MLEIVVGRVPLSQAKFDFHGLLLPLYAFVVSKGKNFTPPFFY